MLVPAGPWSRHACVRHRSIAASRHCHGHAVMRSGSRSPPGHIPLLARAGPGRRLADDFARQLPHRRSRPDQRGPRCRPPTSCRRRRCRRTRDGPARVGAVRTGDPGLRRHAETRAGGCDVVGPLRHVGPADGAPRSGGRVLRAAQRRSTLRPYWCSGTLMPCSRAADRTRRAPSTTWLSGCPPPSPPPATGWVELRRAAATPRKHGASSRGPWRSSPRSARRTTPSRRCNANKATSPARGSPSGSSSNAWRAGRFQTTPTLTRVARVRDDAAALLGRAIRAAAMADDARAIAMHEEVLAKNPESLQARTNLITLYARTGNLPRADAEYRRVVASGTQLADAHRALRSRADLGEQADRGAARSSPSPPRPIPSTPRFRTRSGSCTKASAG